MISTYDETYEASLRDPERFWARAAEAIHWRKRWDRVFDGSRAPFTRWFTGGVLNTCENARRDKARPKAAIPRAQHDRGHEEGARPRSRPPQEV
jgi:hypothetical protein